MTVCFHWRHGGVERSRVYEMACVPRVQESVVIESMERKVVKVAWVIDGSRQEVDVYLW